MLDNLDELNERLLSLYCKCIEWIYCVLQETLLEKNIDFMKNGSRCSRVLLKVF